MSQVYTLKKQHSVPIFFIKGPEFSQFQHHLSSVEKKWIDTLGFKAGLAQICLIPDETGRLAKVLWGASETVSMWEGAQIARGVPKEYTYVFENIAKEDYAPLALGWGLEQYTFLSYKTQDQKPASHPTLWVPEGCLDSLETLLDVSCRVRDWINMPACDLTPQAFADIAQKVAKKNGAKVQTIKGTDLEQQYPLVHAVGRASDHKPHVVDMVWGNENHPKVTLVGKGVTFDTGGLDIKSAGNMSLMKKDMGGAAQALGLADLIMRTKLPLRLRVILPLAENSISGNAYRPSDVITSRKGLTVEIGDTDAEGRLLLADALTAACEEKPDYLFDFATLTGAARVAVGTELSALFCNHTEMATKLKQAGEKAQDPVWELPLWEGYASLLRSAIADTNSCSSGGYAGAITAALFVKKFVSEDVQWAHLDMMAWNLSSKPGRPEGGEVMGLRAVYEFLKTLS
ncbi:MAG: leucyl aminopeptidase family protein [Alphaproteobacteria bacterium]